MKKSNLIFLVGLISGSLMGTTGAHANTIGAKPLTNTDIAKGTLFVKPQGTGTTCSNTLPCDIWTAVNLAKGGDVVFLRGGTYTLSKSLNFHNQGSAAAPVIFESYPGESAVFDGSQHPKGADIRIRLVGKFIQLRRIEIKNMPTQGIWIGGTDNVLDGIYVHHNALSGIQVYSPYDDFPYDTYGSRNIIRNCTVNDNSDAGLSGGEFANGGNADGISISSGTDNRIENCLVYNNSDDGIDTWRSTNTYVGYSISHSNGIADGNGNGIKAGGLFPSADTIVEHNLSYSNKTSGIIYNHGINLKFINNTTWNNPIGFAPGNDTISTNNIAHESDNFIAGTGSNNSWQRSGNIAFISTDPKSNNFLVPAIGGGFDDIGALPLVTSTNTVKIGPKSLINTDIAKGTLFVKPKGTGTTCSNYLPCNIWTAVNKATGGDVVFLRGGTYAISKNLKFYKRGSAAAPIVFESYPGESAVFDGSQHPKGTDIRILVTGKFIQLRRIEVKNMPTQGIWIGGTDNVLDSIYAHHNGLSGIQIFSPYDVPYGAYGSRNIIRNCTVNDNSDAGLSGGEFANGGNADGISISSGTDNRVENCLVYNNSDDGIDTWRSTNTYVGYSISHSNGIADGNGNGIKAGGLFPSADTIVEHNLSYSNKAAGIDYNSAVNAMFSNNISFNNKVGYSIGLDTIVTNNIASEATQKWGNGVEIDNSWQRSGRIAFISTNTSSTNFLVPESGGGFDDIGAFSGK